MTTATVIFVQVRNQILTLDDAINASAVLAEVSACHEEGADRLARMTGLDDLTNDELESLCRVFGVEF